MMFFVSGAGDCKGKPQANLSAFAVIHGEALASAQKRQPENVSNKEKLKQIKIVEFIHITQMH